MSTISKVLENVTLSVKASDTRKYIRYKYQFDFDFSVDENILYINLKDCDNNIEYTIDADNPSITIEPEDHIENWEMYSYNLSGQSQTVSVKTHFIFKINNIVVTEGNGGVYVTMTHDLNLEDISYIEIYIDDTLYMTVENNLDQPISFELENASTAKDISVRAVYKNGSVTINGLDELIEYEPAVIEGTYEIEYTQNEDGSLDINLSDLIDIDESVGYINVVYIKEDGTEEIVKTIDLSSDDAYEQIQITKDEMDGLNGVYFELVAGAVTKKSEVLYFKLFNMSVEQKNNLPDLTNVAVLTISEIDGIELPDTYDITVYKSNDTIKTYTGLTGTTFELDLEDLYVDATIEVTSYVNGNKSTSLYNTIEYVSDKQIESINYNIYDAYNIVDGKYVYTFIIISESGTNVARYAQIDIGNNSCLLELNSATQVTTDAKQDTYTISIMNYSDKISKENMALNDDFEEVYLFKEGDSVYDSVTKEYTPCNNIVHLSLIYDIEKLMIVNSWQESADVKNFNLDDYLNNWNNDWHVYFAFDFYIDIDDVFLLVKKENNEIALYNSNCITDQLSENDKVCFFIISGSNIKLAYFDGGVFDFNINRTELIIEQTNKLPELNTDYEFTATFNKIDNYNFEYKANLPVLTNNSATLYQYDEIYDGMTKTFHLTEDDKILLYIISTNMSEKIYNDTYHDLYLYFSNFYLCFLWIYGYTDYSNELNNYETSIYKDVFLSDLYYVNEPRIRKISVVYNPNDFLINFIYLTFQYNEETNQVDYYFAFNIFYWLYLEVNNVQYLDININNKEAEHSFCCDNFKYGIIYDYLQSGSNDYDDIVFKYSSSDTSLDIIYHQYSIVQDVNTTNWTLDMSKYIANQKAEITGVSIELISDGYFRLKIEHNFDLGNNESYFSDNILVFSSIKIGNIDSTGYAIRMDKNTEYLQHNIFVADNLTDDKSIEITYYLEYLMTQNYNDNKVYFENIEKVQTFKGTYTGY